MPIRLQPETESLVEREIASGRFQSVDEIIRRGIRTPDEEAEAERLKRHREAVAWTLDFARNRAIPLKGVTVKELIEEGRR